MRRQTLYESNRREARRGFTLIEVLVALAIVAILMSILLPALGAVREAGRSAVCLSNLRQAALACLTYADENRGVGPAIGEPYGTWPNWALVVQTYAGAPGVTPAELYSTRSVLVCPTVNAFYPESMTRTYAMNATGHSGQPGDPDDYDDPGRPGHIRLSRGVGIDRPAETALLLDSAVAHIPGNAPPPTRTSSVIDFRQADHLLKRVGWFHDGRRAFDAAMADGSARAWREIPERWSDPLP